MKVIHIIKKIEEIDLDVRELKKLEKSVKKNKSFTTPIYMSIEKQINIMLGERIKMLELKIENPPESLKKEIEGEDAVVKGVAAQKLPQKTARKKKEPAAVETAEEDYNDDDIPMLTQDQIDAKINSLETERNKSRHKDAQRAGADQKISSDASVKILDIALEKGTFTESDDKKDKEKKVKFFRDNFPVE